MTKLSNVYQPDFLRSNDIYVISSDVFGQLNVYPAMTDCFWAAIP